MKAFLFVGLLLLIACTPNVPDAADAAREAYGGIPPTPAQAPTDEEFTELFPETYGAKVTAILIEDASCAYCSDLEPVVADLQRSGVSFDNVSAIDYANAAALIGGYNISRVPTLLLSDDLDNYSEHAAALARVGIESYSGFYVLESPPVYRDVKTNEIRGMVNVTIVEDDTCTACFDGATLEQSFRDLGLALISEKRVDAKGEGKALIEAYNLTKLPAVLLTGDLEVYTLFNEAWPTAGTVEEDGTYVFRNLDALGPSAVYLDVTTGKVVVPS